MQACGQSERTWGRGWRQWWGGCRCRGLKSLTSWSVLELLTKLLDSSHSWFTGGLLRGMWASQGSVQGLSISSIFLRGSPQLPLAGGHRKGVASLLKPWFQHPQGYPCSICFINWRKAAQSDCFAPRSSTFWNLTTAYSSFATSATLHSQGMTSWWS